MTASRRVNGIVAALAAHARASGADVVGCTEAEIQAVEAKAGGTLPAVYREFLAVMGRGAGKLFVGTDIFYPSMLTMRASTEEILADAGNCFRLPDDAFVFLMHQGYVFMYFLPSAGDDPPVWRILETESQPHIVSPAFSQFLLESVRHHGQMSQARDKFRRASRGDAQENDG